MNKCLDDLDDKELLLLVYNKKKTKTKIGWIRTNINIIFDMLFKYNIYFNTITDI